ncbi:hypothetical protein [Thermococcus sp.]
MILVLKVRLGFLAPILQVVLAALIIPLSSNVWALASPRWIYSHCSR